MLRTILPPCFCWEPWVYAITNPLSLYTIVIVSQEKEKHNGFHLKFSVSFFLTLEWISQFSVSLTAEFWWLLFDRFDIYHTILLYLDFFGFGFGFVCLLTIIFVNLVGHCCKLGLGWSFGSTYQRIAPFFFSLLDCWPFIRLIDSSCCRFCCHFDWLFSG